MKCTGYIDDVFKNDAKKKLLSPQNVIERLPIDKLPWVPETYAQFPVPVKSSCGLRPKTRWHAALPEASPSHGRKEKNTGNHGIDMSELTKMK